MLKRISGERTVNALVFCESTAKGFYNAVNAFGCVYACVVVGASTSFFGGLACSGICYMLKIYLKMDLSISCVTIPLILI
ncbi:hypothetical protein [Rossellomorea sp. BNER]|uniref:hypothetical protein n=1 Tax=Rossellomorea sp. BNER TaxID=2962031 RepID=UPI003AF21443|nr:hypothetical protein [Rossellomorea sp. BNER]